MRYLFLIAVIGFICSFQECSAQKLNLIQYAREMKQLVNVQIGKFERENNVYLVNQLKNVLNSVMHIEEELVKRPEIQRNEIAYDRYQKLIKSIGHRTAYAIKNYVKDPPNRIEIQKERPVEHAIKPQIPDRRIEKLELSKILPSILVKANIAIYPNAEKVAFRGKSLFNAAIPEKRSSEAANELVNIRRSLISLENKMDYIVRLFD